MLSKVRHFIRNHAVELGVSVYLLYLLLTTVSPYIYSYVTVWYALDYSYGFGSRLMIGSILHTFTGGYLHTEQAYHFIIGALIVLCLLLAAFAGMVYRKTESGTVKNAVVFLTVLYLASPASPAYLWTDENMGRLDTYLVINTLILAIIYLKVKNVTVKYLLFLAIGIFTISVHQVYIILFFPSLLIMMIQDVWKAEFKKRQILYSVGTAFLLGIFFLYMQFASKIYYDDLEGLCEALRSSTNLPIGEAPLEAEYFWTLKDHFIKNQLPELHERIRFGIITVIMLAPIWGIYLSVWIRAIKSNKAQKYKYILMLLTNLAYVPIFALMTDWGRWFAAFFTVQFLNLMVLCYTDDPGIKEGLSALFKNKTSLVWYLLLLVYVSGFKKFEGCRMLPQVQDFYYAIYPLKRMLFGH